MYNVHYAPHISLIFTDVCFSHVYVLGLGNPLFEMCFHMGINRKGGEGVKRLPRMVWGTFFHVYPFDRGGGV